MWYYVTSMPPYCTICTSPHRATIDRQLVAGVPMKTLGQEFGLGRMSLHRHRLKCVGLLPTNSKEVIDARREPSRATAALASLPSANDLGSMYLDVRERLHGIINQAERQGTGAISVAGLNAVRQTLDSLARLAGHASEQNVNVGVQVNLSATDIAAELASRLTISNPKTIEAVLDE
jgi:hypothetical protein